MTTIGEVKEIFAKKGLYFEHLPPEDLLVTGMEVMERYVTPQGDSKVILNIRYIGEGGKKLSDLFLCEGKIKRKRRVPAPPKEVPKASKLEALPMRPRFEFDSQSEAIDYMKGAISHLLRDKDYNVVGQEESDLYFEKLSAGFFINFTARFDEAGLDKAKELIELRMKHGSENDYGLAAPAFQDSLGIPLLQQEQWLRRNGEFLAAHRIGVYAVNNKNPNQIFPFTVYPHKDRELARYFMYTVQQWPVMRDKYIEYRAERQKQGTVPSPC
jgi:hypothetical protein